MASRKQLKKSIKHITCELLTDCMTLRLCEGSDKEELEEIMTEVIRLHGDYVSRLSHTEPGSVREFYRKLKAEFTEKVNNLGERILKA